MGEQDITGLPNAYNPVANMGRTTHPISEFNISEKTAYKFYPLPKVSCMGMCPRNKKHPTFCPHIWVVNFCGGNY